MVNVPFYMTPILRQEDIQKFIQQIQGIQAQATSDYNTSATEGDKSGERLRRLKTIMSRDTSELSGSEKAKADMMNFASEGFKKGAQGLMNITQQSFDVLNTIYKELKKSSPLLEAVEQLFNLAMTLFFMPLGNKLAEILIPAVIELLDNVVDMWDELGDGGLGEIFSKAIEMGITYLAHFFTSIGETLKEQGGIFEKIGNILISLGNFIENNLYDLIDFILDFTEKIVTNIGKVITLIGTFMTMHYALQLATMHVIAASSPGLLSKALGYAAIGTAAIGIGASAYVGSQFATGGYVPASPGGQLVLVGEGGEGEYIVPKSQAESMGGITNNWYISGLTQDDLIEMIDDRISRQISRSRIQGGL